VEEVWGEGEFRALLEILFVDVGDFLAVANDEIWMRVD
jgi:hypothetical protein